VKRKDGKGEKTQDKAEFRAPFCFPFFLFFLSSPFHRFSLFPYCATVSKHRLTLSPATGVQTVTEWLSRWQEIDILPPVGALRNQGGLESSAAGSARRARIFWGTFLTCLWLLRALETCPRQAPLHRTLARCLDAAAHKSPSRGTKPFAEQILLQGRKRSQWRWYGRDTLLTRSR
jgi:hypothetical protein